MIVSCSENNCPDKKWCDNGETKVFSITNIENRTTSGIVNGLTDLRLTYNQNSKTFELQVILENGGSYNWGKSGELPTLEIRGGEWKKEELLESIDLSLNESRDKIVFKSSILERTFEPYGTRESKELYGLILLQKFQSTMGGWNIGGTEPVIRMIWGM